VACNGAAWVLLHCAECVSPPTWTYWLRCHVKPRTKKVSIGWCFLPRPAIFQCPHVLRFVKVDQRVKSGYRVGRQFCGRGVIGRSMPVKRLIRSFALATRRCATHGTSNDQDCCCREQEVFAVGACSHGEGLSAERKRRATGMSRQ
jgi:hypothetical protein